MMSNNQKMMLLGTPVTNWDIHLILAYSIWHIFFKILHSLVYIINFFYFTQFLHTVFFKNFSLCTFD